MKNNRTSRQGIKQQYYRRKTGERTTQKSVQKSVQKTTERQQAIYNLIKNKGSIEPLNEPLNTERIALLLEIPYSTAKRIVKDLGQRGLIVRVGSKKNGHWEIIDI